MDVLSGASEGETLALSQLTRWAREPERLGRALSRVAALPLPARGRHTAAGGQPYGRTLLHRDLYGEVMLATWATQLACAPHDHGEALGAVLVLEGTFEETLWHMHGGALRVEQVRTARAGDVLRVSEGLIHSLAPQARDGLTLHVYTPASSRMRIFDCARRETLTVVEGHGAWLPTDRRAVVARASWTAAEVP